MKNTLLTILCILTAVLLLPLQKVAADFTIATVDIGRVLNESKPGKEKRKELETLLAGLKADIASKKKILQEKEKELIQKKVTPESAEADAFRKQVMDFENEARGRDEVIQKDFLAFNKELTDKSFEIIKALSEKEHYDLVVDKNNRGQSAVLYSGSVIDVTDKVVAKINSK